jgi:hypothetical protein
MSLTAPPPVPPHRRPSDADPGDRISAWYAASRRRLGVSEDEWYSPAVERLLDALACDEPLAPAVAELGNARGSAGFDLRETVSDLVALAEVLPADEADRLHDLGTTAALSSWADAFIDRVHSPACVDSLTGLVTLGYLRIRIEEVYRECEQRGVTASEAYALLVAPVPPRSVSPFVRLAGRIEAARIVRARFPGGETAAYTDPDLLLVLAPMDARIGRRTEALENDLAAQRSLRPLPSPRCRIEPLAPRMRDTYALLDRIVAIGQRSVG